MRNAVCQMQGIDNLKYLEVIELQFQVRLCAFKAVCIRTLMHKAERWSKLTGKMTTVSNVMHYKTHRHLCTTTT